VEGSTLKFAIIMTCYNRAQTTVGCLCRLCACRLAKDVICDVWLNDDGSTDGTAEVVQDWFSSCVALAVMNLDVSFHLIKGSGHDYWCGGMRRAWQAAIDSKINYDGYLLMNDDTVLDEDALEVLMARRDQGGIVVGAIRSPQGERMTYGGRDANGCLMVPDGVYRECVMMNANAVFVSRKAFEVLGNFPMYFTHSLGDYDYARRAVEHGIPVWTTPKYIGTCDDKKPKATWADPTQSLACRIRSLYSPLSGVQPGVFFRYNLNHDGLCQAIRLWMSQHIRMFFPRLWK